MRVIMGEGQKLLRALLVDMLDASKANANVVGSSLWYVVAGCSSAYEVCVLQCPGTTLGQTDRIQCLSFIPGT